MRVCHKTTVKATTTAIVKFTTLKNSCELLSISNNWAKSILTPMNMVRQKGIC